MRPIRSRRTGAAAAGSVLSTPALRIPPRRTHHIVNGIRSLLVCFAAAGGLFMYRWSMLAWVVLVAGVLGCAVIWAAGSWRRRRNDLSDRLLEALANTVGMRQLDRRVLRLSSWTWGWPGQPRKVTIRYSPAVPDSDPDWVGQIVTILNSRLGGRYKQVRHDRGRCRLDLALLTDSEAVVPALPAAQVRVERSIKEFMGPTAQLSEVEFGDQGELKWFEVTHEAAARLANIGYRNRIERGISTIMPGRWRALWDMERDWVRFEERPSLPRNVWIPALAEDDPDDFAVAVAIDEDGKQVVWRPTVNPHALLTGGTGTGKTSTGRAILAQITARGWPVWVCDAKRVEFLDFRGWPNVQIVAGSVWQQIAVVQRTWELMEYRYQLIEDGVAQANDFDPLVVFLDEFAEMRLNLLEYYRQIKVKGDPTQPPTLAQVPSLARKARTARIHLVISTQRPDVELLGSGEMRDNLGFRVSMGRLSPKGAEMMWENQAIGVSLPRGCRGRAMATHGDGRIVEVQCYRFPDLHAEEGTEEWELLNAMRPAEALHPRLVIVPPQEQTFGDFATAEWALASDRPDLDPLNVDPERAAAAKSLGSTLASLGLGKTDDAPDDDSWPSYRLRAVPDLTSSDDVGEADGEEEWSQFDGYLDPQHCAPSEVQLGDLVEVDDAGTWGVIDEDPLEDIDDGCVALSWRGDNDEAGYLSVPSDDMVLVRRPNGQDTFLSGPRSTL